MHEQLPEHSSLFLVVLILLFLWHYVHDHFKTSQEKL